MPAFANSRRVAVSFLLLSGVVEGLNWLNVSSVFPFFALDLKQNVSALGTITATFLVGEGLFQIPAAIIAGRYSQKRIILYGTAASSVAILLMAFATRIEQIAILRFASGIGMAFTYAPGYILVAKYFDAGSEGTATGMFGAAALFGNVFALIGDSVLPVFVGWRMTLALNGVFGLVVALGLLALLPETRKVVGIVIHDLGSPSLSRMKGILFDRWILAIGSAMLSIEIGSVLASNFMVYYLENRLVVSPFLAGTIAALVPIFGLVASISFGRLYDRLSNASRLIFLAGVVTAAGLAMTSIGNLSGVGFATILVGFGNNAGYIVSIAFAAKITSKDSALEVLGVAWILAISLLASFFAPLLFSFLAVNSGYRTAWLGSSLVMLVLLIPILIVKSREPSPPKPLGA